jgi:hypothetical protein
VKKIFWLSLLVTSLGVMLLFGFYAKPPQSSPLATPIIPENKHIQYERYITENSIVHTLLIPNTHRFSVVPALSAQLDSIEKFAQKHQAIAAINGGFFDPKNGKTTSFVVIEGQLVADPRRNERLINNPKLAPYMKQILNRAEFRRYQCGASVRYDITLHAELPPSGCQLVDALGGGPRLLPELTLMEEGFLDKTNGKVTRDALASNQLNARSAVGITRDGSILFVMVAQKPDAPTNSGISLPALATLMKSKNVEKAMNLDGGSSSSFYYQGKTFYGRLNKNGELIKRPIKSVLLVR